jgi:hypothetical protein
VCWQTEYEWTVEKRGSTRNNLYSAAFKVDPNQRLHPVVSTLRVCQPYCVMHKCISNIPPPQTRCEKLRVGSRRRNFTYVRRPLVFLPSFPLATPPIQIGWMRKEFILLGDVDEVHWNSISERGIKNCVWNKWAEAESWLPGGVLVYIVQAGSQLLIVCIVLFGMI